MAKIYLVRPTPLMARMFGMQNVTGWTFDPDPHRLEVLSEKEVPVSFRLIRVRKGKLEYEYTYGGTIGRVLFLEAADDSEPLENVGHVWMPDGSPLPDILFEVFNMLFPDSENGRHAPFTD